MWPTPKSVLFFLHLQRTDFFNVKTNKNDLVEDRVNPAPGVQLVSGVFAGKTMLTNIS